ncbi:mRNA (2'-O-methyladenosine-N(6)-)-methyltransferase-like [Dermatophagoides pteronyssinus]|uniref:mRNA (2'-O-methyladenosine-N(6)-)-methyltransferase-like n=1 Tax=Dermatophagoides pteronyssinus TaxID=6956 RepID=UPI003F677BD8
MAKRGRKSDTSPKPKKTTTTNNNKKINTTGSSKGRGRGRPSTTTKSTKITEKTLTKSSDDLSNELLSPITNTTKANNNKSSNVKISKTSKTVSESKSKKTAINSKHEDKLVKNEIPVITNNKKTSIIDKSKPKKAQKVTKPSSTTNTTTTKRGRKPKLKDVEKNKESISKKKTNRSKAKQVNFEDDETEEEDNYENYDQPNEMLNNIIQVPVKETNIETTGDMSLAYGFDKIGGSKTLNTLEENPIILAKSSSSYDHHHSVNAHHFDHSNEQNYLGSLYNNNNMNLISSSSTSAFSSVSTAMLHNQFGANHLTTSLPSYTMTSSNLQHHGHDMNSGPTSLVNIPVSPTTPTAPVPPTSQHLHHHGHQSLLSPPQNQNNASAATIANDPSHDLPNELLQQGWRKIWSKREGRFYFYNKNTNQSIWEMPKLSNIFDPMTDPLGIQSANNPPVSQFQPPIHSDHIAPPIYQTLNPAFTPFAQHKNDVMSNDKKVMIGPFDFEIEPNCYIWEGSFFYYFHPHPDIELARFNCVHKLRQQYWELCRARQTIDPPKDSFTKWIIERKIIDKGCDPILPSECINELSNWLYQEIMNDIPIKLIRPKFSGEARKQLSKYAEAAKKIIEAHPVSGQSRKIVKWNVEDAFDWIRKTLNATFEDYIERLEHLKRQCQPHIIDAAKSSVEAICLKIYHVSAEYARRIREMNLEIAKKEDIREYSIRMNNKKIACYPAYLMYPCPKLPPTLMITEKETVILRCSKNAEILRLNTNYLQKLEMLYYFNCRDDRKFNYFLTRVWCLLKRYQSFYDKNEGLCSQNSLPLSVFGALNKHFGVTFECFASPLNCYFRQYCSFFPDTDGYFGSRGSILNFYPISGSFQANPPDSEDLINATITHFEKLLENSMEPLSFIIFIQEKPEISEKLISRLESNKFKRMHLTLQASEHEYRHGFQHVCNPNEIRVKSLYNTIVYFLQNDAGFLKWGPTPERVEELVESFKLDRDKELSIVSPSFTSTNINQNQQQQNPPQPQQQPPMALPPKLETEIRPNGI